MTVPAPAGAVEKECSGRSNQLMPYTPHPALSYMGRMCDRVPK